MVRSYELMVIINPTIEDHSVEVKAIEDVIAKNGGEVTKTNVMGKRRLAYEIKKFNEGIYATFEFKTEPNTLVELCRVLSLRPMVLRYLNIAVE